MSVTCDLCGLSDYRELYYPIGSKRGAVVCMCNYCGLLFTITDGKLYSREPNPSCDADWGNVRFCKGQRLDALKADLPTHYKKVLDVGSSRGHFVRWYKEQNPDAEVVALEPDTRVCPMDIDCIGEYIEKAELPEDHFDFVYCCQTLEHTDSATEVLKAIYKTMRVGGVLFVEVPNTQEIISYPDNTEEYFIDKHNYHFTHRSMSKLLYKNGFSIIEARDDPLNVSIFAEKTGINIAVPEDIDNRMPELIEQYADNIQANRARVGEAVKKINALLDTDMRVAFWGANTLMDLMIKYGGLDKSRIDFLADDYMSECISDLHGIPIHHSNEFRIYQPDVVVILARFSADAMAKRAQRFGVRNIIKFTDLL